MANDNAGGVGDLLRREDAGITGDEEGIPRRPAGAVGDNGGMRRKGTVPNGGVSAGAPGGVSATRNCQSGKGNGDRGQWEGKANVVEMPAETVLQVGERLQEAVRLCNIGAGCGEGGGPLGALTFSEFELSRPRPLLESLRAYSARGADEAEEGRGGEGRRRKRGEPSVGRRKGFLTQGLSEGDARRVAAQPITYPLMETGWLSARYPKVTLTDLLVNRLELSLWASYWKWGRATGATG